MRTTPPTVPGRRVATLGPKGTDAHAEAVKLGAEVVLCDSFPAAMELADVEGCRALVAAGYLDEHDSRFPAWVDLHFGFRKRLKLAGVWESSTKEMCIAVRRDRFVSIESVRSVALHRSTRSLVAGRFRESTEMQFVRAKPLAVQQLVSGQVDACVGSVDVVSQHDELTVVDRFTPSMVWCLYEAIEDRPGFKPALASLTAAAG